MGTNNQSKNGLNRREFVALTGLGTAGLLAGPLLAADKVERKKKGDMYYRQLGRTKLWVSEVSLGGSPAPEERIFREAFDKGVNLFDTSSTYQKGNSELTYGKYFKGIRDKVVISTKFHPHKCENTGQLIEEAEGSLKRLGTDYIDILHIHGVRSGDQIKEEKVVKAYEKLKKDGKVRFTGVSCHRGMTTTLPPVIKSGKYDVCFLAFNVYGKIEEKKGVQEDDLYAASGLDKVFELAAKHKVGLMAMKVQAGGNNQKLDKYLTGNTTAAQAKIKWALARPEIATVNTEVKNTSQLAEDLAVPGMQMGYLEQQRLYRYCRDNSSQVCRMCGTCEGVCPHKVRISNILRYRMYAEGYGKTSLAREKYNGLDPKQSMAGCTGCGKCEDACPYGVAIREGLETADRRLKA